MKKVRLIVAVVAVALMVMGIGYAAWSQILPMNVHGTTSQIDVIYSDAQITYNKHLSTEAKIADDKKSLSVLVDNLYPNAKCIFTATITNNGSMPVVMDNIKLTPKGTFSDDNYANYLMNISSTSPSFNLDVVGLIPREKLIDTNVRIEPGKSIVLTYKLKMDDVGQLFGVNVGEKTSFSFDLTPAFVTTSQD